MLAAAAGLISRRERANAELYLRKGKKERHLCHVPEAITVTSMGALAP